MPQLKSVYPDAQTIKSSLSAHRSLLDLNRFNPDPHSRVLISDAIAQIAASRFAHSRVANMEDFQSVLIAQDFGNGKDLKNPRAIIPKMDPLDLMKVQKAVVEALTDLLEEEASDEASLRLQVANALHAVFNESGEDEKLPEQDDWF